MITVNGMECTTLIVTKVLIKYKNKTFIRSLLIRTVVSDQFG